MRFRLIAAGLLLPFLVVACQDQGKPPPPPAPDSSQAANAAIGVLRQLITPQNYRGMGFDTQDEVSRAQLGAPLAVNNIGLDQLKQYQSSADPAPLLMASNEAVYPVIVDGNVKSSLTIIKKDGGYVPSAFGNADVAKRLGRYRQGAGANAFIVRVPALNFYFLGNRTAEGLFLTPIVSDPRLKLAEGQAQPANQVLAQLVPIARAYNGLPL
jgi:hypothetical protein